MIDYEEMRKLMVHLPLGVRLDSSIISKIENMHLPCPCPTFEHGPIVQIEYEPLLGLFSPQPCPAYVMSSEPLQNCMVGLFKTCNLANRNNGSLKNIVSAISKEVLGQYNGIVGLVEIRNNKKITTQYADDSKVGHNYKEHHCGPLMCLDLKHPGLSVPYIFHQKEGRHNIMTATYMSPWDGEAVQNGIGPFTLSPTPRPGNLDTVAVAILDSSVVAANKELLVIEWRPGLKVDVSPRGLLCYVIDASGDLVLKNNKYPARVVLIPSDCRNSDGGRSDIVNPVQMLKPVTDDGGGLSSHPLHVTQVGRGAYNDDIKIERMHVKNNWQITRSLSNENQAFLLIRWPCPSRSIVSPVPYQFHSLHYVGQGRVANLLNLSHLVDIHPPNFHTMDIRQPDNEQLMRNVVNNMVRPYRKPSLLEAIQEPKKRASKLKQTSNMMDLSNFIISETSNLPPTLCASTSDGKRKKSSENSDTQQRKSSKSKFKEGPAASHPKARNKRKNNLNI